MNGFYVADVSFTDVSPTGGQHHPNCFRFLAAARMQFVRLVVRILQGEVLDLLADLIALDLSGVQHLPLYDLASSLVYGTSGSEVKWSWVAGRCVLRDGQLQSVDYTEVSERASDWSDQLAAFRTTLEQ